VTLSDDEVRAAFVPALRDVEATTDLRLTLTRTIDDAGPVVVVSTAEGSAWYVRLDGYTGLDARIDTATREVQDLVIEELWRHGSNWPVCPKYPTTIPWSSRGYQTGIGGSAPPTAPPSSPSAP
jgi:hypothetical protein